MNSINKITMYGLFFGMIGTTLGGVLGAIFKTKSNKFLSFVLEFAAGLMTAVICFDLIPESLNIVSITLCCLGILLGVVSMIFCDKAVNTIYGKKESSNSLLKTGIIICIGLAIHNFPEGLAIGSGFDASEKLGFSLAIAIALHDIPEGISIALPMKSGGFSKGKSIFLTALSGLTTGIGAFVGAIIGNVSENVIGISLAFAAGAMLYIVSCELIPESNRVYKGRLGSIGNIFGVLIGIITQIIK
jgi:ZIP family zinc transporter